MTMVTDSPSSSVLTVTQSAETYLPQRLNSLAERRTERTRRWLLEQPERKGELLGGAPEMSQLLFSSRAYGRDGSGTAKQYDEVQESAVGFPSVKQDASFTTTKRVHLQGNCSGDFSCLRMDERNKTGNSRPGE